MYADQLHYFRIVKNSFENGVKVASAGFLSFVFDADSELQPTQHRRFLQGLFTVNCSTLFEEWNL